VAEDFKDLNTHTQSRHAARSPGCPVCIFGALGSPPDRGLHLPQLATGRGAWPSEGPADRRPPEPGPIHGLTHRPRHEPRPGGSSEITCPGSTGGGSSPHSGVFPSGSVSILTSYCLPEVEKEKKIYIVLSLVLDPIFF
jgi:hypothetical protein